MPDPESPVSRPTPDAPDKRLESWKQIAAYLGRDARTVQRWELQEGLPVHRHFHSRQGTVYAFQSEIDAWWQNRRARLEPQSAESPDVPSTPGSVPEPLEIAAHEPAPVTDMDQGTAAPLAQNAVATPRRGRRVRLALVALVAVVGLILLSVIRAPTGTIGGWLRLPRASAGRPAGSRDAEALYLQGRYYWEKRSAPDITRAIDYFTQSIVHDPNYAPAYVGLADCYNLLREYGTMPDREAFPRALAAARKAVELDETSSDAHTSLAFASFYGAWDSATAEREFNRAIQLDPQNVRAHHWHSTFLMTVGRSQEAITEINRAQELDPRSAPILADKGLIFFYAGRTEEAVALLRQLEQDEPNFISTHRYLAYVALVNGDYAESLKELREAARLANDSPQLALIEQQQAGLERDGAQGMLQVLRQQQEEKFQRGSLAAYSLAQVCAKLGERKKALEYLQTAYRLHEANMLSLQIDPTLRSLDQEPEFLDLVRQVYPRQ